MANQSLEEMLAALEGATANPHEQNYQTYQSNDGINDIDEFLNELESDSAHSNHNARVSQLIDDFTDFDLGDMATNARPSQQPARRPTAQPTKPAQPVAQQQRPFPPQPTIRQTVSSAGGVPVDPSGEQLLVEEGYARHNNRGKLLNYSKGKATDFRIKGTTSSRVGLIHVITLRSLDDYGEPCPITEVNPRDFIGVILTLAETGRDIQPWFKDNGDATYDIAFYCEQHGTAQLQIKLCGSPMFDISIQIDPSGDSLWVALLQNTDIQPNDVVVIAIITADNTRPEGVVPFEVQTMGDISDLKLMNNGDGTYKFQCVPLSAGHCTINITLHEQPIQNSPITFHAGQQQKAFVKQVVTQSQPAFRSNPNPAPRGPSHVQPQPASRAPSHVQQPAQRGQSYAQQPQQASVNYGRPPPQQQAVYEQPVRDSFYGQQGQYASPLDEGYDDVFAGEFAEGENVTNDDLNRLLDELGGGM